MTNFRQAAIFAASKSSCKKRKVGAVVVKDGEIVSYGFNHGYHEKCNCSMTDKNPHVLHAEQMALGGFDTEIYKGADLYVTYPPCDKCERLIEILQIGNVVVVEMEGV